MAQPAEIQQSIEFLSNNWEWAVGLTGTLALGMAFTFRQRKAIHERDQKFGIKNHGNKGSCQFPTPHECNGNDEKNIHHVLPQRYALRHGVDPDFPENGLDICTNAHIKGWKVNGKELDPIHPDTKRARLSFGRGDKDAFKKMEKERDEKIDEKVPYWNTTHDRAMQTLAVRNTQKAKRFGWMFPERGKKK